MVNSLEIKAYGDELNIERSYKNPLGSIISSPSLLLFFCILGPLFFFCFILRKNNLVLLRPCHTSLYPTPQPAGKLLIQEMFLMREYTPAELIVIAAKF